MPLAQYDQVLVEAAAPGTEFDLIERAHRSLPLMRTYWLMLRNVCEATGKWPNEQKLHMALKHSLGYWHIERDLDGVPYVALDSIAFDQMRTDSEFKPYFDKAVAALAEATGIDPLAFLSR